MTKESDNQSAIILYQTEDGRTRIQCRLQGETLWLTQAQIAELFQTTPQNVTLRLKTIFAEGELVEAATCKDYLQVRVEGGREVSRQLRHYRLEAILAVGYRVRSLRGTQFRQWATARLAEYLVKGFTMDDERLKNPPDQGQKDYFDELLERIRDIRSSERRLYQKVPRYFEPGYLGYEAAEGIDWFWEHRLDDLAELVPMSPAKKKSPGKFVVEETQAAYGKAPEEDERFRVQLSLDGGKDPDARNKLGQFSTPFALARMMVAQAARHLSACDKIQFLEPAVGTGVFFSALLANSGLSDRLASVLGLEIDPAYALPLQPLWQARGFEIRQEDFIAFSSRPENRCRANFICTNPPYVRHHHLPAQLKELLQVRIRQELGLEVSGLAGLYVYFVLLAHATLVEGGVASWLIPSEFLVVNYGRALRDYLTTKVGLLSLHQFDPSEVQFDDALVSSCVVTYRKKSPTPDARFTFSHGGDLISPRQTLEISTRNPELKGRWRLLPQDDATPATARIGDLFTIKRGIATGANGFFLLTREQAAALRLPEKFLRPVLPGPRRLNDTVITADADGMPLRLEAKYLLDCAEPPETVRVRYPTLWSYLERGRSEGVAAGALCASREPWYAQEQRVAAPFLASYMGRPTQRTDCPIRFFKNESRAIVTNVLLNLYPKPWLAQRLDAEPARGHELIALLNSISAESLVHGGRSYGGGLHKVEPSELAHMPLPALPAWAVVPEDSQLVLL